MMRESHVTLGVPIHTPPALAPFAKSTHTKDVFPNHVKTHPEVFLPANRKSFPIGGPHMKCHSDVKTTEFDVEPPDHYEPMTRRQFHSYGKTSHQAEKQKQVQDDMNRSHFSIGFVGHGTDYTTTSKIALVPRSIAEARPRAMTPHEVAASKAHSDVPLMGLGPTYDDRQLACAAKKPPLPDADYSRIISKRLTATAVATLPYAAKRRDAINSCTSGKESQGQKESRISSSVSLGVDKVDYVPATRSQFRGIIFASKPASAAAAAAAAAPA